MDSGRVRRSATALCLVLILLQPRAVNDQQNRADPADRVDYERPVAKEELRRVAAELPAVEQVEIAKDSVEYKGQRRRQEMRVEIRNGLRRHRVEPRRVPRATG